jgi:hypothetical protein
MSRGRLCLVAPSVRITSHPANLSRTILITKETLHCQPDCSQVELNLQGFFLWSLEAVSFRGRPGPEDMLSPLSRGKGSSANGCPPPGHQRAPPGEKGVVPRTNSSSSMHRIASNRNTSTKSGKPYPRVVHISTARSRRTASYGHRTPSFGKGLNKLTALTPAKPPDRQPSSDHSTVRSQGAEMQRSASENYSN